MFKNQKGFTLIELMIVLAIVGILAAVVFPAFNRTALSEENRAKLYQSMIDFSEGTTFGIIEWKEPVCMQRDTDNDGYISCSRVGLDKSGKTVVVHADCAGGWFAWGNEGCKAKLIGVPIQTN